VATEKGREHCPTLRKSSRRIFVTAVLYIRRTCFASRLPARKYFADFRGNKSIFLSRVPRNLPLHLTRRISTRYDTPRKREKETGRSISSIKTCHSTKIHSTRRSSLSPYLLCNTKYTLGIENLHSPFARHRYIDFSSRGTNIRETRKPRFLHMLLSIPSAIRSIDGLLDKYSWIFRRRCF